MSTRALAVRRPPGPIHRLGRADGVWDWPDWAFAGEDGTFSRWLTLRALGSATVRAPFVDVGHTATLSALRTPLAATLLRCGLDDLDAAAIRLSAPRALTQAIARHCYERVDAGGAALQGIAYGSRLGDDVENWAIWEPATTLVPGAEGPIEPDDPDLRAAVDLFGLVLVP